MLSGSKGLRMRTEESVVLRLRPTRRLARPHSKRQSSKCDQSQPSCPNKKETAAFPPKNFDPIERRRRESGNQRRKRSKWHLPVSVSCLPRSLAIGITLFRSLGHSLRGIGFFVVSGIPASTPSQTAHANPQLPSLAPCSLTPRPCSVLPGPTLVSPDTLGQ